MKKKLCPKCKSRFGIFLAQNMYVGKSEIICCYAFCDWKANILIWNKENPKQQFKDNGFKNEN